MMIMIINDMQKLHGTDNINSMNMVEFHPRSCGRPHNSFSPSRLTTNHSLNRQNVCFRLAASALMFSIMQQWTKESKTSRFRKEAQSHSSFTDKVRLTHYNLLRCPFELFRFSCDVCSSIIKENEGGASHHLPFHNFDQQSCHHNVYLQSEIKLMKLKFSVSCLLSIRSNQHQGWDKLEGDRNHESYICSHTTCCGQEDTTGIHHTIGTRVSPPQIGRGLYLSKNTGRIMRTGKGKHTSCMEKHTACFRTAQTTYYTHIPMEVSIPMELHPSPHNPTDQRGKFLGITHMQLGYT
jgi:hypothetical protein